MFVIVATMNIRNDNVRIELQSALLAGNAATGTCLLGTDTVDGLVAAGTGAFAGAETVDGLDTVGVDAVGGIACGTVAPVVSQVPTVKLVLPSIARYPNGPDIPTLLQTSIITPWIVSTLVQSAIMQSIVLFVSAVCKGIMQELHNASLYVMLQYRLSVSLNCTSSNSKTTHDLLLSNVVSV
jgi:hypothetical protein